MDHWNHHWIGHEPLCISFPNLFAGFDDKNITVAAAGKWINDRWCWDFLDNVVGSVLVMQKASNLSDILREIKPDRAAADSRRWILSTDKNFSVKTAYMLLQKRRPAAVIAAAHSVRLAVV